MKKLILKIAIIFVILPGGSIGFIYYLNKSGFFNISEVRVSVEGAAASQQNYLHPKVERLEKKFSRYRGLSLWSVSLKNFSQQVRDELWIESVNIKRSWPNTLSVVVKPHEIKLLLLAKNGVLFPIIEDGNILDPIDSRKAPDVAILEGEPFSKSKELRQRAVTIMKEIPEEGSFSRNRISEVRFDTKEGFWMTLIKTGIHVKMGEEQIALKASRVSRVVDYLETHQFEARVIDANLSKKVLVRLRKDP